MNGAMQEMPGGQGAPQGGQPMGAPQQGSPPSLDSMELQDASPEEQELYERFMSRAMELMYSEKMRPGLKKMLAGGGDPMEGLAKTAAMVTARVAVGAEKKGATLTGDVLFAAGKSIVEDLAEYSTRAGVKDYVEDPKALEGAYYRALDHFRVMMTQAGRAKPDAFKGDMDRLFSMSESGEMEGWLRRLGELEKGRAAPEEGAEPEPAEEPQGDGLFG